MDMGQEERQREEFRSVLFDLAVTEFTSIDPASRSKVYQRLERLYHTPSGAVKFRHFYSDIFIVLTSIQQGDRPGTIDVLGQNLSEIRKGYQPKNKDEDGNPIDIQDSLKKLYDHVSLDIARITYSDWADRKIEQKESIAQIKCEIVSVQNDVNEAKKSLDSQVEDVRRDVHGIQKEYVTILGIFAAVVLAFTGGIAFSTSVLENMHRVSAYRSIVISLIIGIVLINVLYGLFYFISKMIIDKDSQRLKPLFITNGLFVLLLLPTLVAWNCGWIEKRDSRINADMYPCNMNQTVPMDEVDGAEITIDVTEPISE